MKRFSVDQSQCGIAIYPLQMQHDKSNKIVTFCVDGSAKATTSALTVRVKSPRRSRRVPGLKGYFSGPIV